VKKYRRTGPAGKKKRRVKYSYYENMVTGERSDWPPRTEDEQYYYESLIKESAKEAFPHWYSDAEPEEPPPSTAPLTAPPDEEPAEVLESEEGEAAEPSADEENGAETEESSE
jgi:hypothetical protein